MFESYAIYIQIPIVFSIVFIVFQAYKIFEQKEFRLVALGWLINLLYLIINVAVEEGKFQKIIETSFDLTSTFCFFNAIRISKTSKLFNKIKGVKLVLVIALFIFCGVIKVMDIHDNVKFFVIKNFPTVTVDFLVLLFLGRYYQEFRKQYLVKSHLPAATFFYAGIQTLDLFEETFLNYTIADIGFSLGLLAKISILLTLSTLLLNVVKTFAEAKNELRNKSRFAEALNQIIGRTFHEIVPALKELDNRVSLLSEENAQKNNLQINKNVRKELDVIEGDVHRVMTILAASTRMYYVDTLKIKPEEVGFPIPIEPEVDVLSINMIIEIAITNLKTMVAITKNPDALKRIQDNFLVMEDVTFKTEYGGNCNVYGNSVELVQIFYNILKNCYEASQLHNDVCHIFVKTKNIVEVYDADGTSKRVKFIHIDIEDNGPGIPEDIRDRIFTEGFSTKKDWSGKGRGFGLAIVSANTRKYGGKIVIESPMENPRVTELGGRPGTRFKIVLPKSTNSRA